MVREFLFLFLSNIFVFTQVLKNTYSGEEGRCSQLVIMLQDAITTFLTANYCPDTEDPDCVNHVDELYPEMLSLVVDEFIILANGVLPIFLATGTVAG